MAPVLLCPECGAKHPLDRVGGSAFPCTGCGRTLKVPQQVPARTTAAGADPDLPWPRASASDSTSTRVLPSSPPSGTAPVAPAAEPLAAQAASQPGPVAPKPRRAGPLDPIPASWVRFLLWIIAVPLGFVIVFAFARLFGVLNSNQLEDVALAEGWRRFLPIARLLPFVALITAAIVQGAVYGISRLRARRSTPTV